VQEEIHNEQEKLRDNATIYDLLKLEHKDLKKLFKQIVKEERFQESIYSQIKTALQMHMDGEEKLFYPKLENNAETRTLTLESYEAHDVGKKIMKDIDNSPAMDDKFAKLKVLSETIDMHLEEEGELFKKAKRILSAEEEREIARQFMDMKLASLNKMSI